MTLESFPKALREALAAHELLRKLGFSSEQIFIHRNPEPYRNVLVVLKHQGKELALTVGVLRGSWKGKWSKLVEAFNGGSISAEEFDRWYDRSWAGTHYVEILAVMASKGITAPGALN